MPAKSKAEKAITLLLQKSYQAQLMARKELADQKIGLKKQDKAIEQYLTHWNDSIRQGIVAIAYEAVGGKPDNAIPLQVALSFIDATMDIHDDIIDESLKKKKTKTLYGKLGKASTLLIGDIFLVNGFHRLSEIIRDLSKEKQSQIMEESNNFLAEVVKAHITETELQSKKWSVKPQEYLNILIQKGAEIEGRMKIAGIYAGASKKEIAALSKYGRTLGTMLAVRAEFTDLFDPVELSNRVNYECLPLHILYGLQKKQFEQRIKEKLSKSIFAKKDMEELLQLLEETGAFQSIKNYLQRLEKEALSELTVLSIEKGKEHLKLILTSMLEDM